MDAEAQILVGFLDRQREHALGILDGLSEDQLRTPVLPSGWSCLGMINHLLTSEQYWFRHVVAGEYAGSAAVPAGGRGTRNGTAHGNPWLPGEPVEEVFAQYRAEAAHSDAIIAATSLDAPLLNPDAWLDGIIRTGADLGRWPKGGATVRLALVHMIEETGTHAGHLDAARELIDGRQWDVA